MRIMIAAGGTGGHVFPALAVAETVRCRDSRTQVLFVGTEKGLENHVIPAAGFRLQHLPVRGFMGLGPVAKLRSLVVLPKSLWIGRRLIREFSPNVVFGTGGYAAGPVLLQAVLARRPTVLFEPNAEPGFTNRVLAPLATKVAVTFPTAAQRLGSRAVRTGSPVRKEFHLVSMSRPAPPFTVLVFGGSRGATALNRAMMESLPRLQASGLPLRFLHQTGAEEVEPVRRAYQLRSLEAEVRPFFDRMAECFEGADLVVCRSGASTVAELTAAGRAAILVPFPHATDQHQLRNAEALQRAGAARVLPQGEASGDRLASEILSLLTQPERLETMAAAARNLAVPDAAERIADLLESVAR